MLYTRPLSTQAIPARLIRRNPPTTVIESTWALMAGQNVLGVLYVRLRIGDTHQRPRDIRPILWGHGLVLAGVIAAAFAGVVPWLVIVTFTGLMARAIWAAVEARPVPNIKRFGFSEIGVEIVGGLLIAAGWLI